MPADAQRGCFCQTTVDNRIDSRQLSQDLDVHGKPPFLTEYRCLGYVKHTRQLAQPFQANGQILGRLIVHLELTDGDAACGSV